MNFIVIRVYCARKGLTGRGAGSAWTGRRETGVLLNVYPIPDWLDQHVAAVDHSRPHQEIETSYLCFGKNEFGRSVDFYLLCTQHGDITYSQP